MSETIEKLEKLRDDRLAIIEGHKGHIASLQDLIDHAQGEIRGLDLAIKLCEESEPKSANGTPALLGKYADKGLTDAVLDVILTAGNPLGVTAREIVTVLESEGFKTKSKNLYNSVYPVAQGLVEQDRIGEGKKEGKRTFKKK
jgi:hypothetical protein